MNAVPSIQINNERVRVTRWHFAPDAQTGEHVHGYDYVVVPLTTGKLRLIEPDGTKDVELLAGAPYARPAGVVHNVVNVNDFEFVFVEVELK